MYLIKKERCFRKPHGAHRHPHVTPLIGLWIHEKAVRWNAYRFQRFLGLSLRHPARHPFLGKDHCAPDHLRRGRRKLCVNPKLLLAFLQPGVICDLS